MLSIASRSLCTRSTSAAIRNSFGKHNVIGHKAFVRHYAGPVQPISHYDSRTPFPWSNLVRPVAFTVLFTGGSFGLAYWLDTNSHGRRDPDASLKLMSAIIAVNCGMFALLNVPAGRSRILRLVRGYAVVDPVVAHRRPASLLLSGFSHSEVWHLGLNMVALYSFGSAVLPLLSGNQFCAFYGSALCWSSLAQLAVEVARARRGVVPRGSLGASGGIYALLGVVAWYAPETSVYLLFLPFVTIRLGYAFGGMLALDTVGLVRGWSTFGHAAHLTGGATGYLYGKAAIAERWPRKRH